MAWAHDVAAGEPRYVLELDHAHRGNQCGCICVACGEPLTAVNAAKRVGTYRRRPHFRHRSGASRSTCAVLAARIAALRLFIREGYIDLPTRNVDTSPPGLNRHDGPQTMSTEAVNRERIASAKFVDRASAILQLDDGRQLRVVITGTSTDSPLPADGVADQCAVVRIEIDDPTLACLDPSELRRKLRLLPSSVCWLRHWDGSSQDVSDKPEPGSHGWNTDNSGDWAQIPAELRRETLLHLLVKDLLASSGRIRVPALAIECAATLGTFDRVDKRELVVEAQWLNLANARLEQKIGNVIPDVCAEYSSHDGTPLGTIFFEVTVTNALDEARLARIQEANRPTLEIDLRKASGSVNERELESLVVDDLRCKRWLHYPTVFEHTRSLGATPDVNTRHAPSSPQLSFKGPPIVPPQHSQWTTGPAPTDRDPQLRKIRAFYRNGNSRLYAPPIEYDRVLEEARAARKTGVRLDEMLDVWTERYKLGSDSNAVILVLVAAGLVK